MLSDEAAPIADALASVASLNRRDIGFQAQRRLQPLRGRVDTERVEPVTGNAGTDEIKMRLSVTQQRSAVGSVPEQPWVRRDYFVGPARELVKLLSEEVVSQLVGCCEVRHQADQLNLRVGAGLFGQARRQRTVARAEPAHPGVQLYVYATTAERGNAGQELFAPDDNICLRAESGFQLGRSQRAHQQDRNFNSCIPK